MKEITDKLDFIKIKNFCKRYYQENEKPQTGKKYLQKIHLIKDCYGKYKELLKLNSKKTILLKNRPNTLPPYQRPADNT